MRSLFALSVLLCASVASAQTAGTLTWTMARPADLVRFQVAVNGTVTDLGLPATNSVSLPLPDGTHSVVVSACYTDAVCVPAATLSVTVGVTPDPPPRGAPVCLFDSPGARILPREFFVPHLTPAKCIAVAKAHGLAFAGVENGEECYAGPTLPTGTPRPASECAAPCKGDPSLKVCGGSGRVNVFDAR